MLVISNINSKIKTQMLLLIAQLVYLNVMKLGLQLYQFPEVIGNQSRIHIQVSPTI